VGVTKWCADVAPVNGLPRLGDCWHLDSVDKILPLRPDLVIGSVPFKAETLQKLLEQPLRFLALNPRTIADIHADIRLLARMTAREGSGEKLIGQMSKLLAELRSLSRNLSKRPRVYCEAWPNPRISSPPWVAELVRACGGEMAVAAGERVTDAQVAAAQPEIIVLAWAATGSRANPRKVYELDAWKKVPAILHRRVHVVRDELLNTPGPPLVDGARELFRLIHGRTGALS
jgi:iron complex transport system substrate-binding protein